jgi:hypothetical protein
MITTSGSEMCANARLPSPWLRALKAAACLPRARPAFRSSIALSIASKTGLTLFVVMSSSSRVEESITISDGVSSAIVIIGPSGSKVLEQAYSSASRLSSTIATRNVSREFQNLSRHM